MDAYPIGFWNCVGIDSQDGSVVPDWAEAGMTLTQGPNYDGRNVQHVERMLAILDAAHRRGVRLIPWDIRLSFQRGVPLNEAEYRADFRHAVETFGAHPALFGFHAGDEPCTADLENVCRIIRIQRELAPHLKPFCNLLPWFDGVAASVGYTDWGTYLDDYAAKSGVGILCYDCYYQLFNGTVGFDGYFENLLKFQAAGVRNKIPFWTTLLSTGHFDFRCPTENDLRWQLNTAVAHGAQGLMWYMFYMQGQMNYSCNYQVPPIDEHGERTQTYQWLSRVCRTFLKTAAPVVQRLSLRKVTHVGICYGGAPALDGQGLVQSVSSYKHPRGGGNASTTTPMIVSEFRHAAGGDYVMLVNNSQTESTHATLTLQGRHPQVSRVGWDAQETELPANELCEKHADRCVIRTWMAPGQMELYRVRTESQD